MAVAQSEETVGAEIVSWANAVIKRMGGDQAAVEVCVRLVGNEESEQLNASYRAKDKPTNVLSFPADVSVPDSPVRYLGDIVICDPVVQQEAQLQNKRVRDHYAHMVVHGMLHLYGYDHVDPAEADVMEDIEREILGRLGIADPYRPS